MIKNKDNNGTFIADEYSTIMLSYNKKDSMFAYENILNMNTLVYHQVIKHIN